VEYSSSVEPFGLPALARQRRPRGATPVRLPDSSQGLASNPSPHPCGECHGRSIEDIFGYPDNLKFHSCMTLFAHISPSDEMFTAALKKYFRGELDQKTLEKL
jgi:hypothetical protein